MHFLKQRLPFFRLNILFHFSIAKATYQLLKISLKTSSRLFSRNIFHGRWHVRTEQALNILLIFSLCCFSGIFLSLKGEKVCLVYRILLKSPIEIIVFPLFYFISPFSFFFVFCYYLSVMPAKNKTNHGLTTYFWLILRSARGLYVKY